MQLKFQFRQILLLCFLTTRLFAQVPVEDKTLSPYFAVNGAGSETDALPLKSTTANVNISGVIADVVVRQVYVNKGKNTLEAIYVFPGSTRAAVYGMTMQIGNRIIEAEIKKREQARAEYEQAKTEGRRASLLEQDRPNVFQMNVANITPGDSIIVTLRYTEILLPENGVYTFVYPTVVGPRYNSPANPTNGAQDQFIASPYLKKNTVSTTQFDIKVHLAAGMPISQVTCKTHQNNIQYQGTGIAEISLKPEEKLGGNRDFILHYSLQGNQIQSGILLYEHNDEKFFLAIAQPPKKVAPEAIPPREYIFVVDVSGSMRGFPLDISKKLMRDLIVNLRPSDRFNVILFSGTSALMAEKSVPAIEANMNSAATFIDQQQGGGGTELLPALEMALKFERFDAALSRSIVVITDGYISAERGAFELIRNNLDRTNVFSFGIGSGVNRYLIEGLAHTGRGEPFVITTPEEAPSIAAKFRKYIETPVLTQVKVAFEGLQAYEVEPKTIPDILADRPLVIFGKYKGEAKGTIKLTGYSGKKKTTTSIAVNQAIADPKNSAVRYLWARERIRLLDDYRQTQDSNDGSEITLEVTNLGLRYNLLTAFTSFVAIDKEIIKGLNGQNVKVKQALPLPEGVSESAVGFDLGFEEISSAVSGSRMRIWIMLLGISLTLLVFYKLLRL